MKLTYEHLRNPEFQIALQRLGAHPFRDQKLAYKIAKMLWKLAKEIKICDELFAKLLDQYAEKDEKGRLKPYQNKEGTFQIPEANAEVWKSAIKEFLSVEVKISAEKFKLTDFDGVELSASNLVALEPLMEDETFVVELDERGQLQKAQG